MAEKTYGHTDVKAMRNESTGRGRIEGEYVMGAGQKHLVRFLPPAKDGPFYFKYFQHYLPNESVICAQATWRTSCPVCTLADHLFRSRDTDEIAQGRKLYRKTAYITNIIDVRNPDDGVKLLRFGKQIRDQIVSYFADPDDTQDEGIDITDPQDGATIRIEVVPPTGPNDFRKYVCALGKQGPIPFKSWLKKLFDLEQTIKNLTKPKEDVRKLLSELDEDAPGTREAEDEDRPAQRKAAVDDEDDIPDFKPSKRTTGVEDDDDDLPAKKTKPIEEEDEPAPKTTAKPTKRRFVEEEDD